MLQVCYTTALGNRTCPSTLVHVQMDNGLGNLDHGLNIQGMLDNLPVIFYELLREATGNIE